MEVANRVTCIILLILFCGSGSAAGSRTNLFSLKAKENGIGNGMAALAQSSDDGICKSMVETNGYDCEEHTVTTRDGYILSMQRIPVGRSGGTPGNRPPVLVQHGLFMGTLIALASVSKNQLLNMLRSAALLSPIAYMGHMTSPLAKTVVENFIAEKMYSLGLGEFDLRGKDVIKLVKGICREPGVDCTNIFTGFTGQNCCLKSSIMDIFLDHEPQPSSTKTIIHLAQMIRQGTIRMYSYNDPYENTKHYGQPTPPAYNMTNIRNDIPLFLSYSGKDALSDVNDVKLLLDSLKDHDGDKLVVQYIEDYAHADFVMAENAKQHVYDPLIAFFRLQK